MTGFVSRSLIIIFVLGLSIEQINAFSPTLASWKVPSHPVLSLGRARTNRILIMQSEQDSSTADISNEAKSPETERKRSWFSRNVPEDKFRSRKYFDIEERGELLAGPDRAELWGEELTEIGKWQRTKGPIYVQLAGLGFLAVGLVDYFALSNAGGAASPLFTLGIFSALLGVALQRKA